tara:strand:- start:3244 stop:3366 length:123 start_codon:yes stop_codon:yes gene_type:complete
MFMDEKEKVALFVKAKYNILKTHKEQPTIAPCANQKLTNW